MQRPVPPGFAVVHSDEMPWQASPRASVWRKRLEHSGPAEAGRVTSLVRYDPGSQFPSHPHPGGEEILVLEGEFADEHGRYPAGTFLLNPEGFEHAPFSDRGCLLFVKLRQSPGPRAHVRIDTASASFAPLRAGVAQLPLYQDLRYPERILLVRLAAGARLPDVSFPGGEEILVLSGELEDEHGRYRKGSWMRYPPGSTHTPSTAAGCLLYLKHGHLGEPGAD